MPSAEVEFDYGNKTLHRIFDFRHGKKGFGMRHETAV
jgi:hypothetical protein